MDTERRILVLVAFWVSSFSFFSLGRGTPNSNDREFCMEPLEGMEGILGRTPATGVTERGY